MGLITAFSPFGGGGKEKIEINIAANVNGADVYALAGSPRGAVILIINVAAGVVMGATETDAYAINTANFAAGSKVILNVAEGAYITGAGGNGGNQNGGAGQTGGSAINMCCPMEINNMGTIQSGGKGGNGGGSSGIYGGGGGGGGAGAVAGAGGSGNSNQSSESSGLHGKAGTLSAGGAGGRGGGYTTWVGGNIESWGSNPGTPIYTQRGGNGTAGDAPGSVAAVITNGHALTWLSQGTVLG